MTERLNDSEEFKHATPIKNLTVQDYWAWAHSALSANIERGVVAEFLVAAALGVACHNNVRDPWADSDVIVPDGVTPCAELADQICLKFSGWRGDVS